ncbi:MAG TPA: hypothetical protein VFJ19_20205 [Nocardioidaceae bacterium]|nr:hypothetical protein [Nocardioidaceae bacterium]
MLLDELSRAMQDTIDHGATVDLDVITRQGRKIVLRRRATTASAGFATAAAVGVIASVGIPHLVTSGASGPRSVGPAGVGPADGPSSATSALPTPPSTPMPTARSSALPTAPTSSAESTPPAGSTGSAGDFAAGVPLGQVVQTGAEQYAAGANGPVAKGPQQIWAEHLGAENVVLAGWGAEKGAVQRGESLFDQGPAGSLDVALVVGAPDDAAQTFVGGYALTPGTDPTGYTVRANTGPDSYTQVMTSTRIMPGELVFWLVLPHKMTLDSVTSWTVLDADGHVVATRSAHTG